ncbi:SAV_915 family protein [Streptomyces sp. NPDC058486]|uniref:SAV_915 family protein n=1 Tax=unclassified Streptomyces TaxID=2593676 RepID=UPI003656044A
MTEVEHSEDPEPSERVPAGPPLLVPVRSGPTGWSARLFRTPRGDRTAVGFTSAAALAATLGPDHDHVRLAEPALRALVAPLGVTSLVVDPQLSAPAVSKQRGEDRGEDRGEGRGEGRDDEGRGEGRGDEGSWRTWDPDHVGVLRVAGAAALVSCIDLLIG